MSEFKVGDKVVCVNTIGIYGRLIKGKTYTVSDVDGELIAVVEDPLHAEVSEPAWCSWRFAPASVTVSPKLEAKIEQSTFGVGDRVVDEAGYAGTIEDISEFGQVRVLFDAVGEDESVAIWMPKSKLRAEKKIAAVAIPTEEVIAQDVGSAATSKHYNAQPIQAIELMGALMTREEFVGFCKGNFIKYAMRAGSKQGESSEKDATKAKQYRMWWELAEQGITIDPRKHVI